MLTYAEFTGAVMQGVQKANELAIKWSGECAQDQGAEYLLTVEIGRELRRAEVKKNHGGFVLLEARTRDVLDYAPVRPGRPERGLRIGGRIDVTLLDGNRRPIGLVEVKRFSGDIAGLLRDSRRLAAIMRRLGQRVGGTIRYTAMAALRVTKESDIQAIMDRTKDHVNERLSHFELRAVTTRKNCTFSDENQNWYSHALCFTLHAKRD
jgi:hypothetical protein